MNLLSLLHYIHITSWYRSQVVHFMASSLLEGLILGSPRTNESEFLGSRVSTLRSKVIDWIGEVKPVISAFRSP